MGADHRVLRGEPDLTSFWAPIATRSVLRAAWLAGLWAIVAAIVGAALVAALALIGAAVSAVVGFFGDSVRLSEMTRRTTLVGGGVAASLAVVASVWAAAYSSTKEGTSRWRMLAGSAVGVALGLGLVGLGSLGAPAAALAGGWGLAIPAERVERAAFRSIPLALVALLPSLRATDGWLEWFLAGVVGVVAAWVWLAATEGIWAISARFSSRLGLQAGIMQSKTDIGADSRSE